jgi:tRNA dimethylallyltransferase
MNKVFVILGPTSTGKTSLALDLCAQYSGEIISADSRQIYKYMDVGTGKVPLGEKSDSLKGEKFWKIDGTMIWGYDLTEPDKFFSSYDYACFALPKINDLAEKNKTVFLVGGTGFYIDTVTHRTEPSFVEPDFSLRKELEGLTAQELMNRLKVLAVSITTVPDINNPVRIIRSIEKALNKKVNHKKLPYLADNEFYHLGLNAPREMLYSRADKWAEGIWKHGLLEETRRLIDMGYRDSPKLNGLIYKSALNFLDGKLNDDKALDRIKFDLHGYIRRQQTYFKKNRDIVWFDISKENWRQNIYNFIEGKMKNG